MRHTITFYHIFGAAMLVGSLVVLTVLVPPTSTWLIVLFISLVAVTASYIAALITLNRNTRILAGVFFAMLLGMSAAVGFNVLNTIILVCFIIVLKLLLK